MRGATLLVLVASSLFGCRSSETVVSGTVTVDDEPLERGYITFFPVEGTTATRGAEIRAGAYVARQMPTGRFRAIISATPQMQLAQASDGTQVLEFLPGAPRISPQTPGNQSIVEIGRGKQAHDFALSTDMRTER